MFAIYFQFCPCLPTQQLEPSLRTARSTAVRHTLDILMPSRNQTQADPVAEHTHDCLLGRRERVTVRAGLAIPRRLQQEQPCWLFGSGWFLDLPYRVVTIRQVLNTGDVRRARQHVCPAGSLSRRTGAPVTPLCCGLLFLALHDASCSVGLLHKTYAAAPTQLISFCHRSPASRGFAKAWSRARFFFNFYASSRPELPTFGPFSPLFASGVDSRCKKSKFCLDRRGKGLASGGEMRRKIRSREQTFPLYKLSQSTDRNDPQEV